MPSSYLASEMTLFLPCEDSLWKASTAIEWYAALRKPSPYGQMHERLTGVSMPHAFRELAQQRVQEEWTKLGDEYRARLYESMPRWVAALKVVRGRHTKY